MGRLDDGEETFSLPTPPAGLKEMPVAVPHKFHLDGVQPPLAICSMLLCTAAIKTEYYEFFHQCSQPPTHTTHYCVEEANTWWIINETQVPSSSRIHQHVLTVECNRGMQLGVHREEASPVSSATALPAAPSSSLLLLCPQLYRLTPSMCNKKMLDVRVRLLVYLLPTSITTPYHSGTSQISKQVALVPQYCLLLQLLNADATTLPNGKVSLAYYKNCPQNEVTSGSILTAYSPVRRALPTKCPNVPQYLLAPYVRAKDMRVKEVNSTR
ncbi:unnamed protein product [Hydatigera taeniaeformis]|uniref:Cystatin domain-containing protein n=1 Tax=Hydatigena taeniaeformis TaxID=6205 RepID=A0A0R3WXV1_HYDTA|nr:unnamed protein product [Hydatigera taeniaeformis]